VRSEPEQAPWIQAVALWMNAELLQRHKLSVGWHPDKLAEARQLAAQAGRPAWRAKREAEAEATAPRTVRAANEKRIVCGRERGMQVSKGERERRGVRKWEE
jgi:hypothetical protein